MKGLPMEKTRIDLGLRIVIDVDDYRRAGIFMDDVAGAVTALLSGDGMKGRFDFTHFNTRPCKTAVMENFASAQQLEVPGALVDQEF